MPARHPTRGLTRPDLAAGAMVGCFVLAILVAGARAELLAAATLAATIWVGWDALADDRRGPRARLVMALALLMLASLPALLLAFDRHLWVSPPRLRGLSAGLVLWSLGIASIAVGARASRLFSPARPSSPAGSLGRGRRPQMIVAAIVVVSLAAFVDKVGGPICYFHNLNNSAAANAGLTYLIWGISFAKYAAFAHLGENWRGDRRSSPALLAVTAIAFLLLLSVGSRLLVLVSMIQLIALYAALRPLGRQFVLRVAAAALVGAVVFVGFGELRRWENVGSQTSCQAPAQPLAVAPRPGRRHVRGRSGVAPRPRVVPRPSVAPRPSVTPRPSFAHYFVQTGFTDLPSTYVNNYVDTVRSSIIARQVVPAHAGYEYGKELLRLLLQPIPGGIRPTIQEAPALRAAFTSGHGNGNSLPLPVEGYIEFGLPGDIVFCLILGLAVGLVDRRATAARDVGVLLAAVAMGTGFVVVFRGSLHNAFAIAAIDVVGFLVVHRILFRRSQMPASVEALAPAASAVPAPTR